MPIPGPDLAQKRERIVLEGDVPSPIDPPPGCPFHPRCRYATEICMQVQPPLTDYGNGHLAACHHPLNVDQETLSRVQVDANALQKPQTSAQRRLTALAGLRVSPIPRSG